jgi:tRNA (guanine-N7-)-methyltransferase
MANRASHGKIKDFHFHGRRVGRRLHHGRRHAISHLLPQFEIKCTDETPAKSLKPAQFFSEPYQEFWFEIGFGNGEHLLNQALRHPDIGFIGCEPFMNGVSNLLVEMEKAKVKNIRIFPNDARILMRALTDQSLGRCFILHSDPWPKTRHHKRRFIQNETVKRLAELLQANAELRVSSDDPSLAAWSLTKIHANRSFKWTAQSAADWRIRAEDWYETRYETKGLADGRPPFYLKFIKNAV